MGVDRIAILRRVVVSDQVEEAFLEIEDDESLGEKRSVGLI